MLRVTVELVPYGKEDEKRTLETLYIANTLEISDPYSAHKYKAWRNRDPREHLKERPPENCIVFHRRQDGALALVSTVASAISQLEDHPGRFG